MKRLICMQAIMLSFFSCLTLCVTAKGIEGPELQGSARNDTSTPHKDSDEELEDLGTDSIEVSDVDDELAALLQAPVQPPLSADQDDDPELAALLDEALEDDASSEAIDENQESADLESSSVSPTSLIMGDRGAFDPKSGTEMTIGTLGHLVFAPSQSAIHSGTLTVDGARREKETTRRPLSLSSRGSSGGAVIANPKLQLLEDGSLSLTGQFKANGHQGAVTLTDYADGELRFHIQMNKAIQIQVASDRSASLTEFTLTVSTESVELFSEQALFDTSSDEPDTTLTFGLGVDKNAHATTEELPLPVIIPEANNNSEMRNIMLEELVFQIYNPFHSGPLPDTYIIECTARLNHIKISGSAHLPDSSCTITMSRMGIELECDGETPIIFDTDVRLDRPTVEIEFIRGQKPEFGIGGTLTMNLPLIGNMSIPVSGRKEEDGIELSGGIQKKISVGSIAIENPQLMFQTEKEDGDESSDDDTSIIQATAPPSSARTGVTKQTVVVQGTGRLFGLEIIPRFTIVLPGGGAQKITSFNAHFKTPRMNPLKSIPGLNEIPGFQDFILENTSVGLDEARKLFIGGSATILNIATTVLVKPKDRLIQATSHKKWRASESFSFLKGTILDDIIFNNISFVASKAQKFDNKAGQSIKRGLNVFGQVDTSQGIFNNLRKITGGALPKTVTASLVINPNPRHCKCIVQLPFDIKLSSKASLHALALEISGEPSMGLNVILKVTPTQSDPPLLFIARIEFETIGMALSGTMEGFWDNPFGIQGIQVGDLATEMKFSYAVPPVPIAFGLAGTVQVGDFLLKTALKLGADDIILLGEASELPLFFLPGFLKQVGLDLGPSVSFFNAIDMQLEDVAFKFAPTGGQIGTLYFDPGISGQGKLMIKIPHIIDTYAEAGFNVDLKSGFKLYAQMPKLEVGPLVITGKGADKKWDTSDDGPILYMALGFTEQRAYMSAKGSCLGNEALFDIDLGLSGLKLLIDLDAYATPLITMGIKRVKLEAETYSDNSMVGIRGAGSVGFGKSTLSLLGDMHTGGAAFAGTIHDATLQGVAEGFGLPEGSLPNLGLKDLEFYVRFEPIKTAVHAATKKLKKAGTKITKHIEDLSHEYQEVEDTLSQAGAAALAVGTELHTAQEYTGNLLEEQSTP